MDKEHVCTNYQNAKEANDGSGLRPMIFFSFGKLLQNTKREDFEYNNEKAKLCILRYIVPLNLSFLK
jgi:hypothetical protein